MDKSILTTIKKLLNIPESHTDFDSDIVMHINSAFSVLQQLGVGPEEGYMILGAEEKWSDYLPEANNQLNMVITLVHLRVRLVFDPPATSFGIDAIKEQIKEYEWRLNVAVDPGPDFVIPPRETASPFYDPFMADVDTVVVQPL